MPTPTKGRRFGGSPSHQRLIMANLATSLFEHGQITTTEAKAKRLRPYAEHLITKAKVDTVANRRQVVKVIRDKSVLHTLFTEIGPNYSTRPGGYTRITKVGPRKGDNAPMAVIELVEAKDFSVTTEKPKKAAAKKSATKKAASAATSAAVADEAAEDAVDSAAEAEDVTDASTDAEVAEHVEVAEEAAEDAVDSAAEAEQTDDAGEAEEAAADAVEAAEEAETAAEAAKDAADEDDAKS